MKIKVGDKVKMLIAMVPNEYEVVKITRYNTGSIMVTLRAQDGQTVVTSSGELLGAISAAADFKVSEDLTEIELP